MISFQLYVNGNVVIASCLNPKNIPESYEPCDFGYSGEYDYHNYGYTFLIEYIPQQCLNFVFRKNTSARTIGYINEILQANFDPDVSVVLPQGTKLNTMLKDCPNDTTEFNKLLLKISANAEDYALDDE